MKEESEWKPITPSKPQYFISSIYDCRTGKTEWFNQFSNKNGETKMKEEIEWFRAEDKLPKVIYDYDNNGKSGGSDFILIQHDLKSYRGNIFKGWLRYYTDLDHPVFLVQEGSDSYVTRKKEEIIAWAEMPKGIK